MWGDIAIAFRAILMVYGVAINVTIKASKKAMAISPHIGFASYFMFSFSISSMIFILSACLPPSNSVASHILIIQIASFTVTSSAPIDKILLLLCNFENFAVYSL